MSSKVRVACSLALFALVSSGTGAQITRHPTGVNVNATSATSVFITYANLTGKVPVEAMWCGEIVSAAPHVGQRCDPSTVFGQLPLRYDRSQVGNAGTLTDIMTIPASVARRAYQSAARGADSRFYYVRRFVNPRGGPDEFVAVTCRMTGGGARSPFALVDVRLAFATGELVASLAPGDSVPDVFADIQYNGTGRLRGRWELVRPGDGLPDEQDLVTEATLPVSQRGGQRRWLEVGRFDVFLAPGGPFTLPGPAPSRLPNDVPGMHFLLLRIEATDDKEGDSNTPDGIAHTGGLAGFSIPPLRYLVGAPSSTAATSDVFRLVLPNEDARVGGSVTFAWTAHPNAIASRLEIAAGDSVVLEVVLPRGREWYAAPPWITRTPQANLHWRVIALGTGDRPLQSTPWRRLRIEVRQRE